MLLAAFRWGCRRPVHASLRSELPRARRRLLGARGGADQRRAHVLSLFAKQGGNVDWVAFNATSNQTILRQITSSVGNCQDWYTDSMAHAVEVADAKVFQEFSYGGLPRRGRRATPNSPRRFGMPLHVLAAWPHHHAAYLAQELQFLQTSVRSHLRFWQTQAYAAAALLLRLDHHHRRRCPPLKNQRLALRQEATMQNPTSS